MSILFLEYPKCSTCQKAKKWLDENGIQYPGPPYCRTEPYSGGINPMVSKKRIAIKTVF